MRINVPLVDCNIVSLPFRCLNLYLKLGRILLNMKLAYTWYLPSQLRFNDDCYGISVKVSTKLFAVGICAELFFFFAEFIFMDISTNLKKYKFRTI